MPEKVQCPSCQKEYKWNPQLAGKRQVQVRRSDFNPNGRSAGGRYRYLRRYGDTTAANSPIDTHGSDRRDTRHGTACANGGRPECVSGDGLRPARFPGQSTPGLRNPNCCRACGSNAPTKYVEFHQNVGALVMRFHRSVKGNLCKQCIHANFWKMTMTTLAVGWLGYISIILAPIFIINNICRYIGCLGMPSAHPNSPQRA